jgi:hypothetical protein
MRDSERLQSPHPSLQHAAFIFFTGFHAAVLVTEMDFHARNSGRESVEFILNQTFDVLRQLFTALDVIIGIYLYLHDANPLTERK